MSLLSIKESPSDPEYFHRGDAELYEKTGILTLAIVLLARLFDGSHGFPTVLRPIPLCWVFALRPA